MSIRLLQALLPSRGVGPVCSSSHLCSHLLSSFAPSSRLALRHNTGSPAQLSLIGLSSLPFAFIFPLPMSQRLTLSVAPRDILTSLDSQPTLPANDLIRLRSSHGGRTANDKRELHLFDPFPSSFGSQKSNDAQGAGTGHNHGTTIFALA